MQGVESAMDYLTIKEAAKILKVHTNTIYKMCRQGFLPAVKIGKEWRINSDKLDQFLEEGIDGNSAKIIQNRSSRVMESGHILGIFSDRDEFLNFERTFFRSAPRGRYRLLKGCWWQNPDDVRRDLLKSGLPIADLETRGDLVILDLSKTYDRFGPVGAAGAWFKEVTWALDLGYQGLFGSGSPTFTCCGTHEGLMDFESALHQMLKGLPVTAVCSYIFHPDCPQGLPELMDLIEHHDRFFLRAAGRQLQAQVSSA